MRIAAFSLYLAALELDPKPRPPEALRFQPLRGRTLLVGDARTIEQTAAGREVLRQQEGLKQFDVIVGNPPWSHTGKTGTVARRTAGSRAPLRGQSLDFVARAMDFAHDKTRFGYDPECYALLRQEREAVRERFATSSTRSPPSTLINLSDLSSWLFPKADMPAVALLARHHGQHACRMTLVQARWSPAGEQSHTIEIAPSDVTTLPIASWRRNPALLKAAFLGCRPDLLLLDELWEKHEPLEARLAALGTQLRAGLIFGNRSSDATFLRDLPFVHKRSVRPFRLFDDLHEFDQDSAQWPRRRDIYRAPLLLVSKFMQGAPRPVAAVTSRDALFTDAYYGASFRGASSDAASPCSRHPHIGASVVVLPDDWFFLRRVDTGHSSSRTSMPCRSLRLRGTSNRTPEGVSFNWRAPFIGSSLIWLIGMRSTMPSSICTSWMTQLASWLGTACSEPDGSGRRGGTNLSHPLTQLSYKAMQRRFSPRWTRGCPRRTAGACGPKSTTWRRMRRTVSFDSCSKIGRPFRGRESWRPTARYARCSSGSASAARFGSQRLWSACASYGCTHATKCRSSNRRLAEHWLSVRGLEDADAVVRDSASWRPCNMMSITSREGGAIGPQPLDINTERSDAILQILDEGWEKASASPVIHPGTGEVEITEQLRAGMRTVLKTKRAAWCSKMTILPGTESLSRPSRPRPDGRTDIPIFFSDIREEYDEHDSARDRRVQTGHGGSRRSCREYVVEGIDRFVTGKYAGNHAVGFMAGYLLSDDTQAATARHQPPPTRKRRQSEHLVPCSVPDASWARSSCIRGRVRKRHYSPSRFLRLPCDLYDLGGH